MWVICAFDLPTKTKAQRKAYSRFRKRLLLEGLQMIQHSVYGKSMSSFTKAMLFSKRIGTFVPAKGAVKFLFITDKQMGMTITYSGTDVIDDDKTAPPSQGDLF